MQDMIEHYLNKNSLQNQQNISKEDDIKLYA
jgi:hypothetical protein